MIFRHWRRSRARKRPFPEAWGRTVSRNVPHVAHLSPADRSLLEDRIKVFIAEKYFEGCAGLKMTDEIRVTIAAQACLLSLHLGDDAYRGLRSILVYPHQYFPLTRNTGPAGLVTETVSPVAGQSWNYMTASGSHVAGPVILSWNDVRRGAFDPHDGHNVVFHEFAHQLDGQSGGMQGSPALDDTGQYDVWSRVLNAEFENLRRAAATGAPTLLNKYGAQNPAEFFAVITEAFFEKPRELRAYHSDLYEQLRLYYKQDPANAAGSSR